jgi:hypothetical protein
MSVAIRIGACMGDCLEEEGDEKRSRARRRDFCGRCEWMDSAGRARVMRRVVRRWTAEMLFVKMRVREVGWERRR